MDEKQQHNSERDPEEDKEKIQEGNISHISAKWISCYLPTDSINLKKLLRKTVYIVFICLPTLLFRPFLHYMRVASGEDGNSYSYLELCNEARQNGNEYVAEEQCRISARMGNTKGMLDIAEMDMRKGNLKDAYEMLEKINPDAPKDD